MIQIETFPKNPWAMYLHTDFELPEYHTYEGRGVHDIVDRIYALKGVARVRMERYLCHVECGRLFNIHTIGTTVTAVLEEYEAENAQIAAVIKALDQIV